MSQHLPIPPEPLLIVRDLGCIAYDDAFALQRQLHQQVLAWRDRADPQNSPVGYLLLLEHDPPVITISRRKDARQHLTATSAQLLTAGVTVAETNRGGDITYHGPGQLVVYPILDLRAYGRDVRGYVERLEEATIRTLARYGIDGRRDPAMPGVWVDGGKIASIGIHVRRWISVHGLALNVDVDRGHFAMIRPCGLDVDAISIADLVDRSVDVATIRDAFLEEAATLFGWSIAPVDLREIEGGNDVEGP